MQLWCRCLWNKEKINKYIILIYLFNAVSEIVLLSLFILMLLCMRNQKVCVNVSMCVCPFSDHVRQRTQGWWHCGWQTICVITHPQVIQDFKELVWRNSEKFSFTSLAHQLFLLQGMGAIRMIQNNWFKTIIHTTTVHQLITCEVKIK